MRSAPVSITLVAGLTVPAVVLRMGGIHLGTVADTALFGLAIVAAAFLLSWAAEAAEVDIAAGLAVAFIALIAVLPEYAVDMTFAWKAGHDPSFAPYAVANMTGGNRLLIGAAWPTVFFIFWFRVRRPLLHVERGHALDVVALGAATVYSFVIPLKGSIDWYDTVVLAAIFVVYIYLLARAPQEEPELVGPARAIGTLPLRLRRTVIGALFAIAAGAILVSAEPFADGLIHTGAQLGIDRFVLVQWLAPLASEAPEFLVAGILAWHGRAGTALGTLLSSKVNQWTLLIGGLPLAYMASSRGLHGLPLDARQQEELFLTAAQSAFAVAVMTSLSLSRREATLLLGLFLVQFLVPRTEVRLAMAGLYMLLTVWIVVRERHQVRGIFTIARAIWNERVRDARAAIPLD